LGFYFSCEPWREFYFLRDSSWFVNCPLLWFVIGILFILWNVKWVLFFLWTLLLPPLKKRSIIFSAQRDLAEIEYMDLTNRCNCCVEFTTLQRSSSLIMSLNIIHSLKKMLEPDLKFMKL
jgi:hypothetical protein